MPYYKIHYRSGGENSFITIEAADRLEAIEHFKERRIGIAIGIEEANRTMSMFLSDIFPSDSTILRKTRVNQDAYIAALRLIGILLDAGLPITTCLREVIDSSEDKKLKTIFQAILNELENGKSLSDSSYTFKDQLGNLSLSMFKLGEETGTLAASILKLADILEKIQDNRRALLKATRYPLFIIVAMAVAFAIVIVMVVPEFQQVFEESKVELPFPTLMLLWVENSIKSYGPYILGFSILFSSLYSLLYSQIQNIKLYTDRFILKIYLIGIITKYAFLGRFIYIFDVLVDSGVPITKALDTSVDVVENEWMRQRLSAIKDTIEGGHSMTRAFRESEMFESVVLQLIKAGEEGGALNKMLHKISKYYADRYQYIVDNIATMIEPILITAIAGFVLILALGIFLPMWGLVDTI